MRYQNDPQRQRVKSVGLIASGSEGSWLVEIDETISGGEKWFAQFEGPSIYLYFEIEHPQIVESILAFLDAHRNSTALPPDSTTSKANAELKVGRFARMAVSLIWDVETNDRCFILIAGRGESRARFTLLRNDLNEFRDAMRQVRDDLCEEGFLSKSS